LTELDVVSSPFYIVLCSGLGSDWNKLAYCAPKMS
jgi:hypothetical protein